MPNFMDFCILCLANIQHLRRLSEVDYDGLKMLDKLKFCFGHVVYDDVHSSICLTCRQELHRSFEFKKMIMANQDRLKRYLTTHYQMDALIYSAYRKPTQLLDMYSIKNVVEPVVENVNLTRNADKNSSETPKTILDLYNTNSLIEQMAKNVTVNTKEVSSEIPTRNSSPHCIIKEELNIKEDLLEFSESSALDTEREFLEKDILSERKEVEFSSSNRIKDTRQCAIKEELTIKEEIKEFWECAATNEEQEFSDVNIRTQVNEDDISPPPQVEHCFIKEENNLNSEMNFLEEEAIYTNNTEKYPETDPEERINIQNTESETAFSDPQTVLHEPKTSCKSKTTLEKRTAHPIREKKHVCYICHLAFKFKCYLRTHMIVHTGEKAYTCKECHRKFNKKSNLNRHVVVHTGARPYACTECHKKFRQINHLKRHLETHSTTKSYSCKECHEKFNMENSLKKHMALHRGSNLFSCKQCQKYYFRRNSLNRHVTTHMPETGP